jgi:hypothetical protein
VIDRVASRPGAVAVFAIIVAVGLIYAPGLGAWYISDDAGWFWYLHNLQKSSLLALLRAALLDDAGTAVWGGSLGHLMTLPILVWSVEFRFWATEPVGYRLVSLALHLVSAAAVGATVLELHPRRYLSAVAAATIVAASPFAVQTVLWLSALNHVLANLGVTLALLALARFRRRARWHWRFASSVALAAGMFSHEVAVVGPLRLAFADFVTRRFGRSAEGFGWGDVGLHAPFWAATAAYMLVRWAAFASLVPSWAAQPSVVSLEAVTAQFEVIAGEAGNLVRTALGEPPPGGLQRVAPRLMRVVGLIVAVGVLAWAVGRLRGAASASSRTFFLGLGWVGLSVLPLMVPMLHSMRHLHLPWIGCAFMIAAGLARSAPRSRLVVPGLAILLILESALAVEQVGRFAEAGRRTHSLNAVVASQVPRLADRSHFLVVVPGEPDEPVPEWSDTFPYMVAPPLIDGVPIDRLIVSYDGWCCDDWPDVMAPRLAAAAHDRSVTYVVVIWDPIGHNYHALTMGADQFRASAVPERLEAGWIGRPVARVP